MQNTSPYHWQQLNPAQLPPPLRGSSLVFDKKRQQAVFVAAGATWLWDGKLWSEVQGQPALSARNTTHLAYDSASEYVFLFGGIGRDGTPLNDVWLWDGASWTEQHPTQLPPPLGGAAIAWNEVGQQILVFGGITGFDGSTGSNRVGALSNATWIWDGSTWTEQQMDNPPPARLGGQMIYDEARQQTLLFGGQGEAGYLNDMWIWNGASWDQLHPAILPPARARYRAVFHEQLQLVLLLGESLEGAGQLAHIYQTWQWDGTSWSQYTQNALLPGSVEGFAYDGTRNAIIACVVTGKKALLPTKSSGGTHLPNLAPPTLASQTWTWG